MFSKELLAEKNKFNQLLMHIKEENQELKEENDKINKEFKDYIYENNMNKKNSEGGVTLNSLEFEDENLLQKNFNSRRNSSTDDLNSIKNSRRGSNASIGKKQITNQ